MKRNLVGIFALVLAIGFSSFTSKRALDRWFRYDGADNTSAQVLSPANYVSVGASDPGNPTNSSNVLAFIHVEIATEVYASGSFAGKPIVNAASAIRTDLISNVADKTTTATEVSDRIYLK